jgi:hypothetical protein
MKGFWQHHDGLRAVRYSSAALRHEPSSAVPDDPAENPVDESPKT